MIIFPPHARCIHPNQSSLSRVSYRKLELSARRLADSLMSLASDGRVYACCLARYAFMVCNIRHCINPCNYMFISTAVNKINYKHLNKVRVFTI
jgi:hypothetical protein